MSAGSESGVLGTEPCRQRRLASLPEGLKRKAACYYYLSFTEEELRVKEAKKIWSFRWSRRDVNLCGVKSGSPSVRAGEGGAGRGHLHPALKVKTTLNSSKGK